MVPASSCKVSRVSQYSGFCLPFPPFTYGAFTLFGRSSQVRSVRLSVPYGSPYPGMLRIPVWALSIPLAATLEITFVFSSSGYLDVSVRRVPLHKLWIHLWIRRLFLRGFPHSDICGSMCICHSPQLFAAYHVFLRLSVPRHPPCALIRLTFFQSCCLDSFYGFGLLTASSISFLLQPAVGFLCLSSVAGSKTFSRFFFSVLMAFSSSILTAFDVFLFFLVFGFQGTYGRLPSSCFFFHSFSLFPAYGLKWTRTTDLTLIRRAL